MYSSSNAHRPPHSSRPPHPRARSSSDPFSDPVYPAPHIAYNNSYPSRSDPPPPPPKQQLRKSTNRQYLADRDPRMLETAVRDAVTVRGGGDNATRTKVARSQTGGVQTSVSGSSRHPAAPPARRSYSQDSANPPISVEKSRRKSNKKGSAHADVIDRLDFTGVGPMFHHDGPFDACAPSRNRHKSKAPMMAWTSQEDDGPMSAAHFREDRRKAAAVGFGRYNDSPYPNVALSGQDYYKAPNPKQVDRIAEAWGMHEPEPYEEFFGSGGRVAGDASAASSIRGGYESHFQPSQNTRSRPQGRELKETYTTDTPPVRKPTNRLPPPQPIILPGASRPSSLDTPPPTSMPSPPLPGSPGVPKRSKSLMQKIRKMRDQPNVPVEAVQGDENPSPPSSAEGYGPGAAAGAGMYSDGGGRPGRPAHRHQSSFFGRFGGRNTSAHAGRISPSATSENYVYVERSASNKALPPRPAETPAYDKEKEGYFDGPTSPGGTPVSPGYGNGNGNGISRKTSLLKKVRGAVRGANK